MPKLTLTQDEIVQAIRKSVGDMGFKTEGKVINVVLTAGRKSNGHTADVEILDAPVTVIPSKGNPRGTVINETVQVATEVAEVQLVEEAVTEVAAPAEEEAVAQAVETDDLFQEG